MNLSFISNDQDIPDSSSKKIIDENDSFNKLKNEEDYLLIDEYNAEVERLGLSINQILPEPPNYEYPLNFPKEQESIMSEEGNNIDNYIKYEIPESFFPKFKAIEDNFKDNENNSNENKDKGKIKDKKPKEKRKNKKNIIRHKGKKKKIIEEDKKNKFISLKLFNPKGDSEECKKVREEIDKIIYEIKPASTSSEKNPFEKKLFFISNEEHTHNPIVKKRRKENPDNIIKKVKHKFLKSLKNRINIKLKMEKSKYLFDFFPFIFVSNINKQKNKNIINKKLIELYRTNFFDEYTNENLIKDKNKYLTEKNKNEKKYNKNLKVIEYLEKNINIMKKTNFDYIKEMTYGKIFNEYLESRDFEEDILKLKKIEKPEYIKNYIIKAYTFIEYFSE